jgi:hypothetical protein
LFNIFHIPGEVEILGRYLIILLRMEIMTSVNTSIYEETAEVICSLAAIVGTTAMSHQ